MLTVKAPIELKCTGLVLSSGEEFCHRIMDNYKMISARVSGEDLLHLANTPPEVFLAESGMTNVSNQMNLYQSQENKVEIINNLINRILVSGSGTFTYQDRVYITNMLHKLGITDERQFMTQVSHIREEIDSRSRLIDLYWNHSEQLAQLVEEYQSHEHREQETKNYEQQELHLHEEILNRLQTGAIYQLIQNFSVRRPGSIRIMGEEMQLAEQGRTASTILLQRLQSVVRGEEVPLIYRHDNYYEQSNFDEETVTKETVTKQMVSAVLLNIIDSLYESRHESYMSGTEKWYSLENSFYRTAENTLQRFRSEINKNEIRMNQEHSHLSLENQSRFYKQETKLLTQLFSEESEEENAFYSQPSYDLTENRVENSYRTKVQLQMDAERRPGQPETAAELVTHRHEEELTRETEQDMTSLKEELDRINERNVENYKRYLEMSRIVRSIEKKPSARERKEQMRRESLQALENPQELLLTYREEAADREEQQRRISEEVSKAVMPESSRQIYRILEQYMQQPEIWQTDGNMTVNNISRLQSDIAQADMTVLQQEQFAQQKERIVTEVTQEIGGSREGAAASAAAGTRRTQSQETLSFVHRQTTNAVDEDIMEQLLENRHLTEQKNIVTQQTNEVNQTVNTHQTWQHVNRVEQKHEDVTELIRTDIQRQIGAISDQVYSRLEKRLQNEKKRRGY